MGRVEQGNLASGKPLPGRAVLVRFSPLGRAGAPSALDSTGPDLLSLVACLVERLGVEARVDDFTALFPPCCVGLEIAASATEDTIAALYRDLGAAGLVLEDASATIHALGTAGARESPQADGEERQA